MSTPRLFVVLADQHSLTVLKDAARLEALLVACGITDRDIVEIHALGESGYLVMPATPEFRVSQIAHIQLADPGPRSAGDTARARHGIMQSQATIAADGFSHPTVILSLLAQHDRTRDELTHLGIILRADVGAVDGTSHAGGARTPIRLAKISSYSAWICDVNPSDLTIAEYDPFDPEQRWTGRLRILDEERIEIVVGDYALTTDRRLTPSRLSGFETHPNGTRTHMGVFLLSGDPQHLTSAQNTPWISFLTRPADSTRDTAILPAGLDLRQGGLLQGFGVWGGQDWWGHVQNAPQPVGSARTVRLTANCNGLEIHSRAIDLTADQTHNCYRSAAMMLYPTRDGDDLLVALGRPRS